MSGLYESQQDFRPFNVHVRITAEKRREDTRNRSYLARS